MALPLNGTVVKAKRLGWDEELTAEEEFDMEPYEDKEYESDDLEGPITTVRVPAQPGYDAFISCLVGGQEADPTTVESLADTE